MQARQLNYFRHLAAVFIQKRRRQCMLTTWRAWKGQVLCTAWFMVLQQRCKVHAARMAAQAAVRLWKHHTSNWKRLQTFGQALRETASHMQLQQLSSIFQQWRYLPGAHCTVAAASFVMGEGMSGTTDMFFSWQECVVLRVVHVLTMSADATMSLVWQ
jgi:hypothetical protein